MPVRIPGGGGKIIKDATATPQKVRSGEVFYNNNGRQIGTLDFTEEYLFKIYTIRFSEGQRYIPEVKTIPETLRGVDNISYMVTYSKNSYGYESSQPLYLYNDVARDRNRSVIAEFDLTNLSIKEPVGIRYMDSESKNYREVLLKIGEETSLLNINCDVPAILHMSAGSQTVDSNNFEFGVTITKTKLYVYVMSAGGWTHHYMTPDVNFDISIIYR